MLGDNQEAGVTLYSGPPEFHQSTPEEKLGMAILFIIAAPFLMVGAFVMVFVLMAVVAWSPTLGSFDMQVMFFIMLAAFGAPVFFFVRWCVRKLRRSRGR